MGTSGRARIESLQRYKVPIYDEGVLAVRDRGRLLWRFDDGSREYVVPYDDRNISGSRTKVVLRGYRKSLDFADNSNLYMVMASVLEGEGYLKPKDAIKLELHTLEFPDGSIYQFQLPDLKANPKE